MTSTPLSPTTHDRYHCAAIMLHWLMALGIVALWLLGKAMAGEEWMPALQDAQKPLAYGLHKAVGLVLMVLVVLRVALRFVFPPPAWPAHLSRKIKIAAEAVHGLLYVLMLLIPLTGWLMSSADPARPPVSMFGLFDWPRIPVDAFVADWKAAGKLFNEVHGALNNILFLLLIMHVGAAIYHTFIRRDGMLMRMLPACGKCTEEKCTEKKS